MADDDVPTPASTPTSTGGLRSRVVVLALVAGAFGAFVVQNTESQRVDWLLFDFTLPLWALLVASAAVGAVVSTLLGWIRSRRD